MPDLGALSVSSIPQDLASRTLQAIRESLNGRTQKRDLLGRIPTPSYDELRQKEFKIIEPWAAVIKPLDPTGGDFRMDPGVGKMGVYRGGPEIDDPAQRIDRSLFIYDLVTNEKVAIQFVPQELDYSSNPNWEAISAMARNNPLYHYTGGEDTLKFTIDWFAEQENRQDVLERCKKIEALTKNDGFDKPPHHVKLIWNNLMFSDSTWIVASAGYRLSMFQAHQNMMPQQAYQEVVLKRVSQLNTGVSQIRSINF